MPLEDLALDCRPLAELGLEWIFNTWGSDENFVLFLIEDALLGRLLSLDADSLAAVLNLDCEADPLDILEVGRPSTMTSQGLPSRPLTNSKTPEVI